MDLYNRTEKTILVVAKERMGNMNWKIAYAHQKDCMKGTYNTIEALEKSEFDMISAKVPGNFELDLMREGRLHDLYFATNTLDAQKLEDVHVWYFCKLTVSDPKQYLHFEGIDTFADVYVNGKLAASTDNMFLPVDVRTDWFMGENEVVVHIKPAMLMARLYELPAACFAMRYNYSSLYIRKAAHMFGWDIMPRIVSAGIWKDVTLRQDSADQIKEVYLVTNKVEMNENGTAGAQLRCFMSFELEGTIAQEYFVKLEGCCGESCFSKTERIWHSVHALEFTVEDCRLWWPKNAGEPDLYDVKVTLFHGEEICDIYQFKAGIRTVELVRTDVSDKHGSGDFCFVVNGKRIFVLGTNWVPLDAFHSNDINRLDRAMEMVNDIGCNMIRCWGGNVYESDEFFDYCDTHGIMVWQDFGMGCGVYPNEKEFEEKLEREAVYQIKRLRNHASLALWAGDNECDCAYDWRGLKSDPNQNTLTRRVLKHAVELHDYSRNFLPSSPYISVAAHNGEGIIPENHLWGPRDYFKGDFYKNTFCHFASETGYHGFPSPESLKKFLNEPEKIFREDGRATDEYLVHAASMETEGDAPYAYRIQLAYDQVVTLFGSAEEDLGDFVRQSQISQAEAKKYFIEKFRIGKGKRTGIIWWNLLDGWPQVSDAIVDYYFTKKLAYHYIKRSQEPVCLMFDEPADGKIQLVGVNDLPGEVQVFYQVKKIHADKSTEEEICLSGEVVIEADSSVRIEALPIAEDEKEFYLIEWELGGQSFKNHYFINIIDIDYQKYMAALRICGMDEFEGF